jgi:hypothetical protein
MQRLVEDKINTFKHSVLTDTITRNDRMREKEETKTRTAAQRTRDWANEIYVNSARYYDEHRDKWDKGRIMLDYPELTSSRFNDLKPILKAMQAAGIKPRDIEV